MTDVAFLRIDDRLVHGQVIVGWLPVIKPDSLVVVNDSVANDDMRQDLMSLSVPADVDLEFYSTDDVSEDDVSENTFILVSSPRDAWACLQKGIKPKQFNVGGMHAKEGKKEIFEALHVDDEDRKYFDLIIKSGVEPIFQPTPQNQPKPMGEIL